MSEGAASGDHGRVVDFGRTASDYEHHRPGFPESFFERLMDNGWIASGQRALDLGTGTGSVALGISGRGLEVTGLDVAPELLEVARRTAAYRELPVEFVEGQAEATGLGAASFDLVTAGQCWWWFDAEEAIQEIKRVLVPDGRLIICDFSYLPLPEGVAGRTEDLILQHNPGWTKAGWGGVHPEQVDALDRGGFQQVESFSYLVDVPFSDVGWRGRVRTCNGVGAALSAEQVERFDEDLAGLLAREFPGELSIPHRVFATSGLKG